MKQVLAVALLVLAGCGADGLPERPEPRKASEATVSGTVEIGVTGG